MNSGPGAQVWEGPSTGAPIPRAQCEPPSCTSTWSPTGGSLKNGVQHWWAEFPLSRHDGIKHWPQGWTQSPALLPSPSRTSGRVERGVLLFSWLRPLQHTTTDWEVWMIRIHVSQLGRLEVQDQGACWCCSLAKALNPVYRLFSIRTSIS